MHLREIMRTEVVTLSETDHLDLADSIMRLGRIRHIPVVAGERVVGIVSQRDLYRAALSTALHLRPAAEREWLAKIPIREVMVRSVITATPDTGVREAVERMLAHKIGCLPIVEGGRLVGLVSETDFLQLLVRLWDLAEARRGLPPLTEAD